MKDFVICVKLKKFVLYEYQGGSFVILNFGMFGIENFDVVINLSYGVIFVVGVGIQILVVEKGEVVVCNVMFMMFLVDYCVIDGVLGVQFLEKIVVYLENLMGMLV